MTAPKRSTSRSNRSGGRAARIAMREDAHNDQQISGFTGGRFKPLTEAEVLKIHKAAIEVLQQVGIGILGEMPEGGKRLLKRGATLTEHGRISIPPSLVEDILAQTCRRWTLHGLDPDRSLDIHPQAVHYGTAGGAVEILDFETREYRQPELADLYDVARLIDTLPHINWCYRPLIARDLPNVDDLDINTAYALATGTTKPWGITIGSAANVDKVISMFDMVMGKEGQFKKTPTAHMVQGAGVPPLRFASERCLIKDRAIQHGMPIMIASAPQAGATAPAALAGTLVQVVAEVLGGILYANMMNPGHPLCFAAWPFVSDLRTGAMTGGSGEQALLMAGVSQMAKFYDLPNSVAAGMADSKLPDAQSGFEKAYTTALAGLAGASMVHESAGMHASLIGCAYESFVIDNDMLGSVMRTIRGIEVTEETLSVNVIADVNLNGPGHYLGHDQTIALMESEYHYPPLSDRKSPREWEDAGSKDILERSRDYVRETLSHHYPTHINDKLDDKLRETFNIKLPKENRKSGNGRW